VTAIAVLTVLGWTGLDSSMGLYEATAHAFSTLAIGGFSTQEDSMAAFGVANTMLMGTFERRREFAVMKSLGMRPGHVTRMVMAEALVLGLLAVAAGALIALPLVLWLTHHPLDLTAVAGEQMYMDTLFRFVLRVEHSWDVPLRGAAALVIAAVAAAVYPAFRANRVPAAEALAGR
jgi:putative ABC transport system permease protein